MTEIKPISYRTDIIISVGYILVWLFMIAMNVASTFGTFGLTNGEISDRYPVLIVPAGRAFSIWGLIFALIGAFTIWIFITTLMKGHVFYLYKLILPFFLNNIFNGLWSVAFSNYSFIACLVLIIIILVTNIMMYLIIYHYHAEDLSIVKLLCLNHKGITNRILEIARRFLEYGWISIYTGWISVATIVNFAVVLKYDAGIELHNTTAFPPTATNGEFIATIVMITVALLIGIGFAIACLEWGFLLTVGWAVLNIASRCNSISPLASLNENYHRCQVVANVLGSISIVLGTVVLIGSLFRPRGLFR